METPVITLKNPTDGMPVHPFLTDRPVIWAEENDRWLFRLTTNILVPKVVEKQAPGDPLIRYTVCAIKRALEQGGGIDLVIWQEMEEIQPENKSVVVVPVLCFGPSRMMDLTEAEDTVSAAMVAFKEVYKEPRWITQFDHREKKNSHVES